MFDTRGLRKGLGVGVMDRIRNRDIGEITERERSLLQLMDHNILNLVRTHREEGSEKCSI